MMTVVGKLERPEGGGARSRHEILTEAVQSFAEAALDTRALAQAIVRGTAEALGDYCGLGIVSADGKWLEPGAIAGSPSTSATDLPIVNRLGASQPLRIDGPHPLAHALATGEPELLPAITDQQLRARFPRPVDYDAAVALNIKQVLFVPLRARGVTIGGMSIVRHGEHAAPFVDADLRFAQQLANHAALAISNAQLFANAQRELAQRERMEHRQRLLAELAQEFSAATGDHRGLVDLVARRLGELVGESCLIRFLTDSGEFEPTGSNFHPDPELAALARQLLAATPQRMGDALSGRVAASGRSILVPELDPERLVAQVEESFRPIIRRLGIRSVLIVPLILRGKVLGVVSLARSAPGNPYTDDDRRLVEAVSAHAVLAITNARLFADRLTELGERRRIAERLRVLSESSRDFAAATGDSAKLIELAARRFGEVIGESCVIRLVAADGQALETTGSLYHRDPAVVESARLAMLQLPQRLGEGIAGQVMATGRPIMLTASTRELSARVHPSFAHILRSLGATSFLSAPLLSRGRVIGVITMTRSSSPPYADEDLEFVRELATHASLAIHNSRLLESVQRELAEHQRTQETLRRTEEQFRQAQKMEAVGRLAGGVAHDFNNLLCVILSYTGFLLDDMPAADRRRDDLVQIQTAGKRAEELTRQLLAFSRQQVLAPQVLDLNEVITDMEKMIRRVAGEDISVQLWLSRTLGMVEADPGRLSQVVMNLIVNARDAMPDGGKLTIETYNIQLDETFARHHFGVIPGAYVMLAISDTGIGIDKATQQRIFEPFFTTKDKGKGTGLGLSTVLGIVEQSGGKMWFDSEPGKGATFRVYLPRTTEKQLVAERQSALAPLRGGETVMLVEDDAQVRAAARNILQRNGYKVIEAASGHDALQLCAERALHFELLVTDVVMPKMSGRELADRLIAAQPGLRVLYMSGYIDEVILHQRMLPPGLCLLEKPFTPESLLGRVREVLGTRELPAGA